MKKIPSFEKNHDLLDTGLYKCGISHGGTTWDLRSKKPNGGDYISPAAIHTVEHLIATVLRNSERGGDIIYFGPMGCRTGYYLLTVNMDFGDVLTLLRNAFEQALAFDEVPGNKREECGNYLEHDLDGAKRECKNYLEILNKL